MPRSMCSEMPKPKQPVWEKLRLMSSNSFTLRPDSRICMALSRFPTVTCVEIFSLRRMPKVRTV